MGRGFAWFDAGTPKSLLNATQFISVIQDRQNFKIACPEEIAYSKKYINKDQLMKLSNFDKIKMFLFYESFLKCLFCRCCKKKDNELKYKVYKKVFNKINHPFQKRKLSDHCYNIYHLH